MNSKLFLLCFTVFCSCLFGGYSRKLESSEEFLTEGLDRAGVLRGNEDGNSTSKCLMELLPCEPYLKSSSPPPATCCVPMKKVVAEEAECLCNLIHDSEIMKSFNVTMDDALKLAKACGANADMSKCNAANSPTSSPTPPFSPSNSSTGTGSSSSNDSPSSSSSSSSSSISDGFGIPNFARVGFIAFLTVV